MVVACRALSNDFRKRSLFSWEMQSKKTARFTVAIYAYGWLEIDATKQR